MESSNTIKLIDFNDPNVSLVLPLLLKDKTTKRNILWATDSYSHPAESEMLIDQISNSIIEPRVQKAQEARADRTKTFAEVFTPSWICNQMNNYADESWFGRKNVFNIEQEESWVSTEDKVVFSEEKPWTEYVYSRRLEITCGEAPFIVSRYDASTGETISIKNRIGILDRKLRIVNENTDNEKDWLLWTTRAFQSVYGYEFQGDNLLIARINLLMTFTEYLQDRWYRQPDKGELRSVANIIAWNIWQMDGFTNTVPFSKPTENQLDLFAEEEQEDNDCLVYDWRGANNSLKYRDIGEKNKMKFDFVLGNPPYQEEVETESTTNGQKPRKNIFHFFQIAADSLIKESSVLIYPGARWMHQSGKGLQDFGKNQINDNSLSKVIFYPDSKEVFGKLIDISDGITIVVKKKNKSSQGFEYTYVNMGSKKTVHVDNPGDALIPLNPNDIPIIQKINSYVKNNKIGFLHDAILPRSLFPIESDLVEKNPSLFKEFNDGDFVDSDKIKIFTNDKAGSAGRAKWFIGDKSIITRNKEYIDEWQVVVSSAHPGGQEGRDNQLSIIDNHSVFGRSRVALRSFKTQDEAVNFYKYCNSYLVKFAFLMTDEALTSLAKQVPDFKDYTDENAKLDFNSDLDTQLYKLFKFSVDEILYIQKVVDSSSKKEVAEASSCKEMN